jgi:glycosyltransferase involved in cell wall biosynthesis
MRILHVTEVSNGGTLELMHLLAGRLAGAGETVAVAARRRPARPDPAVEYFELPWADRSLRGQLAALPALRRLVREWRPDVVHLHSSFAGVAGALALPRRVPTVFTPHGLAVSRTGEGAVRGAAHKAIEAAIVRRHRVVAAVSETEAALARTALGARRVTVVANGVPELDPGAAPEPRERPEPVVAAGGRVVPQRRPESSARILSAVADLARVKWIGGADDDAARPLVERGVPLTGWLPRDQALEQLAEATVYLHWSAWDGLSLAVLEAFAYDVVVVASDIAANREALPPGQLCRDEDEAIRMIRGLLADPELRAAALAEQHARRGAWSAARMTAQWRHVYERVAGEAGGDAVTAHNIKVPWSSSRSS